MFIFQISKFNLREFFTKHNTYKNLEQWSKEGKNIANFDPVWMGLLMFSAPTEEFGWDGISMTMKVVRKIAALEKKVVINFF